MPQFEIRRRGEGGPALFVGVEGPQEAQSVFDLLCGLVERPFALCAFWAKDWNGAFSPWPAPPVFGKQAFAGKADGTLRWLADVCLPAAGSAPQRYIGGYSLAGLFSLWAFYQSGLFDGAASCSGSLWYPAWAEYAQAQTPRAQAKMYLSLGEREPLTRNAVMARVGEATQAQFALAQRQGLRTQFVWHAGGHFQEPDLRLAKGLAWLVEDEGAEGYEEYDSFFKSKKESKKPTLKP